MLCYYRIIISNTRNIVYKMATGILCTCMKEMTNNTLNLSLITYINMDTIYTYRFENPL